MATCLGLGLELGLGFAHLVVHLLPREIEALAEELSVAELLLGGARLVRLRLRVIGLGLGVGVILSGVGVIG